MKFEIFTFDHPTVELGSCNAECGTCESDPSNCLTCKDDKMNRVK